MHETISSYVNSCSWHSSTLSNKINLMLSMLTITLFLTTKKNKELEVFVFRNKTK